MDFMKTESEVDPLTVQPCDDAGKEEADPSPDEENLLDLNVTKIKEEYVDDSYNHTSKIKFEEIILPNNFPVVKCEAEEENLLHLEVTGMKTNCLDHSCDLKSEIKVEDTPEPVSFSVVKSEADEDLFDVDRVQPKQKVEVSSEEDEVFSERVCLAFDRGDSLADRRTPDRQLDPGRDRDPSAEQGVRRRDDLAGLEAFSVATVVIFFGM
ncbi:uncharacterized protein [Periplaneta americana]|uniref:uncharacterized protein isoform X5 n=1 Tax=Periplaneta americana TaxID=6978 RepID=UPI0037E7D625